MKQDNGHVLITGASAGIGRAFAELYADKGFDLVLTARRRDRLEDLAASLAGVKTVVIEADLADPEAPEKIFAELTARGVELCGLVNNAGYGVPGRYQDVAWRAQADFIQVLVTAPCHLARLAISGMIARGHGRIINVASVAAYLMPPPAMGLYASAKSFLLKFSETLHFDCLGTGVHVTALCPGLTRSEFHEIAGLTEELDRVPKFLWMEAQDVVRQAYEAVERNQAVCVNGWANKAAIGVFNHLPDAVIRSLVLRGQSKMTATARIGETPPDVSVRD